MAKNNNFEKRNKRDNGSGSIIKRKDGRWMGSLQIGFDSNGKQKRIYVYGKSEAEAKRKLKEKRNEYIKKDNIVERNISVKKWFSEWLEQVVKLELKPKSFDAKERCIDKFIIPELGNMKIAEVTTKDVQNLINKMTDAGYSFSQIHKVHNTISQRYKQGILTREVNFNPAQGVSIPQDNYFHSSDKDFVLTEVQIELLLKAIYEKYPNGTPIYPRGDFFVFLLYTGLRIGEAIALKWEDIDFKSKTINVNKSIAIAKNRDETLINPKTNKPYKTTKIYQDDTKTISSARVIPMSKMAQFALANIKEYNSKNEYVLANSNGVPSNPSTLNKTFKAILKRANIKGNYSLHSLRHTFASMLFSKNVDIKVVSELLGHSSTNITYKTYIHLIKNQKAQAVDLLNKIDF